MIFGNSEPRNHGEWIIDAQERRSLHATARDKTCDYHSPPHVRFGLLFLKYEHLEKWTSDQPR